jgi:WD40 repeat protein
MRILQGHRYSIRAVAFHPMEPAKLVSAGDDRLLRVWDLASGEMQEYPGHRDGVLRLAFAVDGGLLVSGGRDGLVLAWDRHFLVVDRLVLEGPIQALALSPLGVATVAPPREPGRSSSRSEPGLLWRPGQADYPVRLSWAIIQATNSPSGGAAALATEQRQVLCGRSRALLPLTESPFPQSISALQFSPNSSVLAIAYGPVLELWDWQARQRRVVCRGHKGVVNALAFTPDSRCLLTGSGDRSARLWDVATGQARAAWRWDIGPIGTVAVSPDGMLAAAGGEKKELLVWDLDGV